MLTKIAAFELRYQLRSPLFVVGFVLFFLLAFASVTSDSVQIGGAGNVNINSPYALLQTLGIINIFALFVVTAFVANVVIRDDDTRFAPIMNFFSIQSARYAQKRDVWMSSNGKPVDLAVYYHPAHEHNVQRMLDAMKTSLDLF
ncbi:MAG: hypothetical protein ACK45Y_08085, partial [Betaproteobacteria bacterium]